MALLEADIERVALEWLDSMGYEIVDGATIAPGEPAAERSGYGDVVLVGRLTRALQRLNPGLPRAAIEEAVVNAVYHRSYEIREPVEVRITTQDLVVLSFPGPDRSIKLDDLRQGRAVSRRYRNRRIGEFLKELDLTEARSTGISKIIKAMAANGSPAPEFETDDERSHFIIRLPVHALATEGPAATTQVTTQDKLLEQKILAELAAALDLPTTQVPPQVATQATQVLRAASVPLSREELQHAAALQNREHFRKAYLKPLLHAGWLVPTLPDKPRSPRQRYLTTALGHTWLARIAPPSS